ncbi:hypothetical protein Q1695_001831 [Nippostrongylus brasiliensis]|nr:hypothetical protein Q1695_001831 [Nippostrongylus brasiliensis]
MSSRSAYAIIFAWSLIVFVVAERGRFESNSPTDRRQPPAGSKVLRNILFASKVWLTADQARNLNALQTKGDSDAFMQEITEAYRKLGDKTRASLRVQSTCRTILTDDLGQGQTDELIAMKAKIVPSSELVAKLNLLFQKVKSSDVKLIQPLCVAAYQASFVRRLQNWMRESSERSTAMKGAAPSMSPHVEVHSVLTVDLDHHPSPPGWVFPTSVVAVWPAAGPKAVASHEESPGSSMPLLASASMLMYFILLSVTVTSVVSVQQDFEPVKEATLEVDIVDTRLALRSSLLGCTINWRDDYGDDKTLSVEQYWDIALRTAKEYYPDSVDCLMSLRPLVKKYKRMLALMDKSLRGQGNTVKVGLDAFLSRSQIENLRRQYESGNGDEVLLALERYFEGLSASRRTELINELLDQERGSPKRHRRDATDVPSSESLQQAEFDEEVLEPEELQPEWLAWQTPRHKKLISKMIIGKASKWEVMNEIGDQFYHLRKEVRDQYKQNFRNYCIKNVKNVIGEENFLVLRGMYMDTDPIEQMETKFHELVAELPEERERLLADHYAVFCRKIFRLVHFEPTDLTIWLSTPQKTALGQMIQNPNVNDTQIYDKMYEFYTNTTGEQKEEASDIIESGCRHFIAHLFGDDNAEELEELRQAGSVSKQHLAARLAMHASEVSNEVDRKRAEGSLSICSRIYLDYDGSCECNGHATECDHRRHQCLNCTDNTYGVQCELCLESFTGNPLAGGCTPVEAEETSCTCNGHSESCDPEGRCLMCLHNTTGDSCERCFSGFYGDATTGTRDDCTMCPCPGGGDCFVNEQNLVECTKCPTGKQGITCEEDATAVKDEQVKDETDEEEPLATTPSAKVESKEEEEEEKKKDRSSSEEKPNDVEQREGTAAVLDHTESNVNETMTDESANKI